MKTGIIVFLAAFCLFACSKRLAELQVKYPVQNGRYTILDDKSIGGLGSSEIEGLYMREVTSLMGNPLEKKSYYERKHHTRFFITGTTQVRSDEWIYQSNEGSKIITVKFEDKTVAQYSAAEKTPASPTQP